MTVPSLQTTPGSGKSLIALGLADTLHRHADRLGFFKPVVHGDDAGADPMVALMKARFDLDVTRLGVKPPQILMLKVDPVVSVEVRLTARR